MNDYGTFISSKPSLSFRERTQAAHLGLIQKLVPGEICPAHLFYSEAVSDALAHKNCAHFFIFRDPRDVAVSAAFYFKHISRWHRLHSYFDTLSSRDDQISAAILGVQKLGFPFDFPDITARFRRYQDWLENDNVFAIKFEDLMSSQRRVYLREMAMFWARRQDAMNADVDNIVNRMEAGINPDESPTFRKGEIGGWKSVFTHEHVGQIKSVAGELLIELGYETSLGW